MCVTLLREIQQLTELEIPELSSPTTHPLLNLIASHASNGKLEAGNNKALFVVRVAIFSLKKIIVLIEILAGVIILILQTLPDQQHCYFLTENRNMEGILVHSIPFTHPCHVSRILIILRQQALFNTIITSCVRQNSKQGCKLIFTLVFLVLLAVIFVRSGKHGNI